MKTISKTMMKIAAFAAVTAGIAATQTADRFVIQIPHEFHVGDRTMPAGRYSIASDPMFSVWVRGIDTPNTAVVQGNNGESRADADADPNVTKLVFRVHNGSYYLASVWNGGTHQGRELPESPRERELELAGTHTTYASLIAKK